VEGVRLFVGGLDYRADKRDLQALFSAAGRVVDVYTPFREGEGPGTGRKPRNKGYAFVEMGSMSEAALAVDLLDGTKGPYGRVVSVMEAEARRTR